jgi:hypothetical protein
MNPNSLTEIMQELDHIHGDIKQLGYILLFVAFFLHFFSRCK